MFFNKHKIHRNELVDTGFTAIYIFRKIRNNSFKVFYREDIREDIYINFLIFEKDTYAFQFIFSKERIIEIFWSNTQYFNEPEFYTINI